MITPPKNPPPPGFKMTLRFTSGSMPSCQKQNITSINPTFKGDFLYDYHIICLIYTEHVLDVRSAILTQMMDLNSITHFYTPGK